MDQLTDRRYRLQSHAAGTAKHLREFPPLRACVGACHLQTLMPDCSAVLNLNEKPGKIQAIKFSSCKFDGISHNNKAQPLIWPSCVFGLHQVNKTLTGKYLSEKLVES